MDADFEEWYNGYVGKLIDKAEQDRQAVLDRACGPLRRQVKLLARELAKARILPYNCKSNRCEFPFIPQFCEECWEKWSEGEAMAEEAQ